MLQGADSAGCLQFSASNRPTGPRSPRAVAPRPRSSMTECCRSTTSTAFAGGVVRAIETLRVRGVGFRSLTEALDTTTAHGRLPKSGSAPKRALPLLGPQAEQGAVHLS